ncbi:ribosome small subunit-dependent GTPase A [Floccifex sp.]|uniref:ribosome small subunit-dependent GTPase A n=1 Tax=Floccifex sp. TaxID=2815810 RepID=UPI003F0E1819
MIDMEQGTIIKIISNQYTIDSCIGEVVAIPRGKLRKEDSPVVGDVVFFEKIDDAYRIHSILPRKNRLLRPAISNVDQALIVTSVKDPDYSCHLLNRLIFLVSLAHVKPVIVVTKMDLVDNKEEFEKEFDSYVQAGYEVFYSYPGHNDEQLKEHIDGKISVLCGQSGAGKSSLLNRLDPEFKLQTQEISKALGRGKHTTRHCQLHKVCNGWVADTPGFSSLDFTRLDTSHLDSLILDFQPFLNQCRFKDCIHVNEPDCAIKEAVHAKKINASIYQDYKQIKEEKK